MYYEYADSLQSEMRAEMAEEYRHMAEMAATELERGEWCVVGYKSDWPDGIGLQASRLSREAAEHQAREIAADPEYRGVLHEVMTHDEYDELLESL